MIIDTIVKGLFGGCVILLAYFISKLVYMVILKYFKK